MKDERLKARREELGMTTAEVAVKSECSIGTLVKLERGGKIRPKIRLRIERTLGLKRFLNPEEQRTK